MRRRKRTSAVDTLFVNEFIYMDKVKKHREENTVTLACKHYFSDIKNNDLVILTRYFPTFFLLAGTEEVVDRVILHQHVEVTFFTNANLTKIIPKIVFSRYKTSLVKKSDVFY